MTHPAAHQRIAFDPVCGSPLPPLYGANPFCDGGYTYYFCSAMCRRFFIDQRDGQRRLNAEEPTTAASDGKTGSERLFEAAKEEKNHVEIPRHFSRTGQAQSKRNAASRRHETDP